MLESSMPKIVITCHNIKERKLYEKFKQTL
jgi:hypothetical protein